MSLSLRSRNQRYWLVSVILGLAPWGAYLRPYTTEGFLLLGIALALALAATSLLVGIRLPNWAIVLALPLSLVLCSSAATFLASEAGINAVEKIPPINGYTIVFGGLWALFAFTVRAVPALWGRIAEN